jgi:hypothetical protein
MKLRIPVAGTATRRTPMTDFHDICTVLTFAFSGIALLFSVLANMKNRETERLLKSIEEKQNHND